MLRRLRHLIILLPLAIATFIPIWTVWYVGSWEANGQRGNLIKAATQIPKAVQWRGLLGATTLHSGNLTNVAVLIALGVALDFALCRPHRNGQGFDVMKSNERD